MCFCQLASYIQGQPTLYYSDNHSLHWTNKDMSHDSCLHWSKMDSALRYKFVSEPDRNLVCVICLEIAEKPWQHNSCGRLLCEKCLDQLGRNKPCPYCREIEPQYFLDARSKYEASQNTSYSNWCYRIPLALITKYF